VPFRLEILEKKIKYNSEKAINAKYSKKNLPGAVAFYDTQLGNKVGLFYNTPQAHALIS